MLFSILDSGVIDRCVISSERTVALETCDNLFITGSTPTSADSKPNKSEKLIVFKDELLFDTKTFAFNIFKLFVYTTSESPPNYEGLKNYREAVYVVSSMRCYRADNRLPSFFISGDN
ncbi:hypothetical protein NPIL_703271 [Nephila pilipes]|uniref:Uncharacterized protein n=1 Tax=Nephila pilipes TaxID=299642 RepID=A0A8X6QHK3_NEPPI|nr:hypothetical protein NPIL_703271 [Nephila pilipes]